VEKVDVRVPPSWSQPGDWIRALASGSTYTYCPVGLVEKVTSPQHPGEDWHYRYARDRCA